MVLVIAVRCGLVGPVGFPEPLGAIAGMVFAMVTRASYTTRWKWLWSLDWRRVSRMPRGSAPCSQEDGSVQKPRPGFDELGRQESFVEQYGRPPVQPDDKSRARGVNSVAAPPMFGG